MGVLAHTCVASGMSARCGATNATRKRARRNTRCKTALRGRRSAGSSSQWSAVSLPAVFDAIFESKRSLKALLAYCEEILRTKEEAERERQGKVIVNGWLRNGGRSNLSADAVPWAHFRRL